MDKNTLSEYGWVIIIIILLSFLLATVDVIIPITTNRANALVESYFDKDKNNATNNSGPQLIVEAPTSTDANDPTISYDDIYTVKGEAFDEDSGIKSVTVNGEDAVVETDGSWSLDLDLVDEETTEVIIVATSNADKQASEIRYVKYDSSVAAPISYYVRFNANGGVGYMSDVAMISNEPQNLPKNAFTKTGYAFKGWATTENGGVTYTDQAKVSNLSETEGDIVNLYAVWEVATYAISYTLNGGTVVAANPTSYNINTPTFTLNNPAKDGFTFSGWTGTDLSGGVENVFTDNVSLTYESERCYTALDFAVSLSIGKVYKILWDGVEYEREAKVHPYFSCACLGNPSLYGDNTDSGEPFLIASNTDWNSTLIASADTANASHTINITRSYLDMIVTVPTGSTGEKHYIANWKALSNTLMEGKWIEEAGGFNRTVPETATSVVFTDETAPVGTPTTDVSLLQDGGVVAWSDGNVYKVSTQRSGVYVQSPPNADYLFAFYENEHITSIDLTMLDTSETASMHEMFDNNSALRNIIVGNKWNTSNVQDFQYIFAGCFALESLDLSSWDFSSATDMSGMFNFCSGLKNITFAETIDTSKVKMFYQTFYGCRNLTDVDVSNFDTSSSTRFADMFKDCENIKRLDISNFSTESVSTVNDYYAEMEDMFDGMLRLEEITIGAKFSFNGDGLEKAAVLPTPIAEYITGANGNWYDTNGNGYTPLEISTTMNKTANTYYAIAPSR